MTYTTEVLADTPEFFAHLGEASGTTMTDASGNGRNGTYNGGITKGVPGLLSTGSDTAISIAGANGSYAPVTYAAWQDTASFSADCLIKPTGVSGNPTILSRYGASFGASRFVFRLDGNKLAIYGFTAGGGLAAAVGTTVLTTGTTYHVGFSYDGTNLRLYLNGVLEAGPVAVAVGGGSSGVPLTVGARNTDGAINGANAFTGTIDEIAYYGTALSAARFAAHYAAATAPPPAADVTITLSTSYALAVGFAPAWSELIPGGTDTDNASSGRSRGAFATGTVTRAVEPTPPGITLGEKVDKAIAYPNPTMVDGRPT